jgi:glucokinase
MADLVVGLDLGGTQLRAALIDRDGVLVRRAAVRSAATAGPETVVGQMAALVATVTDGVAERVGALGLSAPGPLDSDRGITFDLPNLDGFDHFPLRDSLADRVKLPVAFENDGIAAAVGEWRYGAGRGLSSFVYVTVSTGIGGGVISDGRILRGRFGMAGHLGHITLIPDGDVCGCGNRGCFEAHASGTALVRAARRAYGEAGRLPAGAASVEAIDGRLLAAAARAGDAVAGAVMAREASLLGQGFVSILHALSPEAIVVGGGVSQALDLLLPGIRAEIAGRAMAVFRDVPIVAAALGDNSGLVGAAGLAFALVDAAPAARAGERRGVASPPPG